MPPAPQVHSFTSTLAIICCKRSAHIYFLLAWHSRRASGPEQGAPAAARSIRNAGRDVCAPGILDLEGSQGLGQAGHVLHNPQHRDAHLQTVHILFFMSHHEPSRQTRSRVCSVKTLTQCHSRHVLRIMGQFLGHWGGGTLAAKLSSLRTSQQGHLLGGWSR